MAMPDPGERAPDFALFVRYGDQVRLSAALEKGPVVSAVLSRRLGSSLNNGFPSSETESRISSR